MRLIRNFFALCFAEAHCVPLQQSVGVDAAVLADGGHTLPGLPSANPHRGHGGGRPEGRRGQGRVL